ncbi:MAG TPA: S49 family peptidase, partial [candidate division Zixibacteria bacterium]|nr:S49 family peptidase [candidate division Zixibacteria bacterium]
PPARALRLGVAGRIEENPTQPVFGRRKIAFLDYVLALRRAATDESVGKVYLTLGANSLNWAQAQEIRSALEQLSALGKSVTVYLAEPSNRNYFLACSADKIILAPVGYLGLTGLYAELTFVGGTLEKLGVKVDGERIGEHKTAPEFFTNREPSEANKAYVNRLLDEIYDQFVAAIAVGRGLSPERVREIIDKGPLTSREALEAGLVDVLAYPDEVKKRVPDLDLPVVSLRDYLFEEPFTEDWIKPPVVAVVVAEGEIRKGAADGAPLSEGSVSAAGVGQGFSQARATPGVRGIAFRVNSPGGSALESDLIYRQADLARERLPLNVSLGGVAASGGYYIAAPGRRVFASPATITGSIGIYALKPDFSGLYEKIELGKYSAQRGENAGIFSPSKPFSDSERERLSSGLQAFYQRFIQVVGENRGLAVDSVDALGRGRVWTGREALRVGLVDSLGGLWEAIAATAADAGLEEFEVRL